MVLDFQPYTVVEDTGFQRLLNVLEPSVVPKMYDTVKSKIQTYLNNSVSSLPCLSLTSDLWTSRANDSYISLTCHYLDECFNMTSYVLGNSNFPGEHTGASIYCK
ncbi:hypothetical protein PR048_032962 [Dryococelus australis]|uniref:Uncharacterized protein n=1 Tax=Dryococelus australis TaxID=614101 RepID=A0ABQ9G3Q7_9NEOP|nr:hypothetical protein PR048_032962 [Dryococelus australis]